MQLLSKIGSKRLTVHEVSRRFGRFPNFSTIARKFGDFPKLPVEILGDLENLKDRHVFELVGAFEIVPGSMGPGASPAASGRNFIKWVSRVPRGTVNGARACFRNVGHNIFDLGVAN